MRASLINSFLPSASSISFFKSSISSMRLSLVGVDDGRHFPSTTLVKTFPPAGPICLVRAVFSASPILTSRLTPGETVQPTPFSSTTFPITLKSWTICAVGGISLFRSSFISDMKEYSEKSSVSRFDKHSEPL